MTSQRDQVIHQWMQAAEAAKAWTAREQELRLFIARQGWGFDRDVYGVVPDGTHRMELGNNYSLKLTIGTDWIVKDGAALRETLNAVSVLNTPLPKPLVSWTPKLSLTAYKDAPEHIRTMLQPALETKYKMPTLTLETPK